jgi:aryl-alcohol dehydrogenase-like predicted oxidoreductase
MGGWTGSDDEESLRALDRALALGCNFFDTAWSTTSSTRRRATNCFPTASSTTSRLIARVPFDEGSLTGTLTPESTWPDGDWRNIYFARANLEATLARVDRLTPLVPERMALPEMALRYILANPAVSTTIPGHAPAAARRAQPRGQRRRAAAAAPGRGAGPTAGIACRRFREAFRRVRPASAGLLECDGKLLTV